MSAESPRWRRRKGPPSPSTTRRRKRAMPCLVLGVTRQETGDHTPTASRRRVNLEPRRHSRVVSNLRLSTRAVRGGLYVEVAATASL